MAPKRKPRLPQERGKEVRPGTSEVEGKQARQEALTLMDQTPLWAFIHVDIGGPWCWSKMDGNELRVFLERLKNCESMPWKDLQAGDSHFIDNYRLGTEAQKRLAELNWERSDSLFSLRITGPKRAWGHREGRVLYFVWWDPLHEVYPVPKRHT